MNTNTDHCHDDHSHPHNLRLSIPPRPTVPTIGVTASSRSSYLYATATPSSSSLTSPFPFSSSYIPSSTPSKRRHPSSFTISSNNSSPSSSYSSLSSLFLFLFSLRSLYSLLPFLRSAPPSFSLFPFSFLVSLSSLLLTSVLSFIPPSDPHHRKPHKDLHVRSLLRPLAAKSLLLALVFLLRFQALRFCGTATTILVEFSGSLSARSLFGKGSGGSGGRSKKFQGFVALGIAVLLQSLSWHRVGCFLFSRISGQVVEDCLKVLPVLLPFSSGFIGYLEHSSANWVSLRPLGRKKIRVFSLGFTTLWLFLPALAYFLLAEDKISEISIVSLGWPLVNTVIFGVVLGENNGGERSVLSSKEVQKDFLSTFCCTLVLELFYFPQFSMPGFLFCGFLTWIAVNQLCSSSLDYVELGGSTSSESFYTMIRNPVRHILGERKSRKIALFLLINTVYMVVEFVAGFMSNSLGLLSDACHMLFDCAALAIGLYASYISRLPANGQFNYGLGRFEVLSGYVNAVFLVLVGAIIVLESLERIFEPQEISTDSLLVVSIGGFLVNAVGLIFFHEEHHHAHGGGGSCSHSHSHHHQHSHVNHHHSHICKSNHHLRDSDKHHFSIRNSSDDVRHQCPNHDDHQDRHLQHYSSGNIVHKDVLCSNDMFHTHNHRHPNVSHEPNVYSLGNANEAEYLHHEAFLGNSPSHGKTNHIHEGTSEVDCSFTHEGPVNISVMPSSSHTHSVEPSPGEKHTEENKNHHHIDHNMQGIFLHVLADTLGSVGVIFSTVLIKYKGWLAADPACSIFISLMIITSVLPLLRNSAEILLQRVPNSHENDLKIAMDDITRVNGVHDVQNVHVWSFTNVEVVGSLNIYVSAQSDSEFVKRQVAQVLHDAGIKDLTIQVERLKT